MEKNEFFKGALWAASIAYRDTGDDNVADKILQEIENLDYVAANSTETDLWQLRLYVNNELPLGYDANYQDINCGPLDNNYRIVKQDCAGGLVAAPGDILFWCVYATDKDGDEIIILDNITDEECAMRYVDNLKRQMQAISNANSPK